MKVLIHDVAEVINDLCSLNLLDRELVTSKIVIEHETSKRVLTVDIKVVSEDLYFLCTTMFNELYNSAKYEISYTVKHIDNNSAYALLSYKFYESF